MTWDGTEKVTCWCGKPAGVVLQEGKPNLFCFAHSYAAGMMAELPEKKPTDWSEDYDPKKLVRLVQDAQVEKLNQEFEDRPQIRRYRELALEMVKHEEDEDDSIYDGLDTEHGELWFKFSKEEQDYVRSVPEPVPQWALDRMRGV